MLIDVDVRACDNAYSSWESICISRALVLHDCLLKIRSDPTWILWVWDEFWSSWCPNRACGDRDQVVMIKDASNDEDGVSRNINIHAMRWSYVRMRSRLTWSIIEMNHADSRSIWFIKHLSIFSENKVSLRSKTMETKSELTTFMTDSEDLGTYGACTSLITSEDKIMSLRCSCGSSLKLDFCWNIIYDDQNFGVCMARG